MLVLLSAWISERRVLRNAEACSARSLTFSPSSSGLVGRVSYLFMGENGEYLAGSCLYYGRGQADELGTIVFRNVQKWELNKIAMAFLFHRLVVLSRGVTDLDGETAEAQRTLAESTTTA